MEHIYTEETKIADIVASNPIQMLLFEHLGIGLMVGSKSVGDVCREFNICPDLMFSFIRLYDGSPLTDVPEFHQNDIDCILNYLKNSHQYYLGEKIPKIHQYVERIINTPGNESLSMLRDFTDGYIAEVKEHFQYENDIVFPYVTALTKAETITSGYSVTEYKQHHTDIDEKLEDLKNLLLKYLPFNDESHLRRKMLQCLYELEYDLKIHSHIEDNILIPLVEKLEITSRGDAKPHSHEAAHAVLEDNVLSSRETDVLLALIQGLSNKEVAEKLFISTNTVITHRKNIIEKTGIKSLAGLTIYAIVHHLIDINDVKSMINHHF